MKTPPGRILALALCLGLAASVCAQTRNITNKLVVHLTFDGTMNDNSGRTNNATYDSHVGLVTNPPAPTYLPGKLGQAFQFTTAFDGSRIEFATLGYPADLKFGDTNDWSVAFWIYNTNNVGDPAFIANKNWWASGNPGWGIFAQNGGNFRVQMTDAVTTGTRIAGTMPQIIRDGAWHHLAVTLTVGGTRNIYLDGSLISSVPNPITGGTDTDSLLNGEGQPFAVNIGQDGTGGYNDSVSLPPPVTTNGDSGIYSALIDDVGFWRRALSDVEVASIYNYAQLGTNLYNVPDVNTPVVLSFTPGNGSAGVIPNIPTRAVVMDQGTAMDTNTVQLFVDGVRVTPVVTKDGTTNVITYTQPYLFAPSSLHTNKLVYADNSTPTRVTNTTVHAYTIAAWTNIYLPPPLYFESFDELPLATNSPPTVYPAGWTASNCTDPASAAGTWDLFNERSDTYLDWVIIPINDAANPAYINWDGNILNVYGSIVVNGSLVPVLGSNNVAMAVSDGRSGSQIQYLFTGDYDLTAKTNIHLAYYSMYTQNQDNGASVEYSIDQGVTWLPIVYMLPAYFGPLTDPIGGTDIITNLDGSIDASNTLAVIHTDVAYCTAAGDGYYYGYFIGVARSLWSTLGPYISPRTDDNQSESHRVEVFRLPQADGQAHVRFRFMNNGTDSWDWAIDNFGLYSISAPPPLQITGISRLGSTITINWNGTGPNFGGLQKATKLNPPNWKDIPGTIGQTSYSEPITGAAAYYRAVRY